jgi:hypothetical protein
VAEAIFGSRTTETPRLFVNRATPLFWVVPALALIVASFLATSPARVEPISFPPLADSFYPSNVLRVATLPKVANLNSEVLGSKRNLFLITTFDWTNGGHSPLGTHSLPSAQTNRIML